MSLGKLALLGILSCSTLSVAVRVKMPDVETLNKNLADMGLQDFNEITKIADDLADKDLPALDVAISAETHLNDYKQDELEALMPIDKSLLLHALLQHSPEALAELACRGLYDEYEEGYEE